MNTRIMDFNSPVESICDAGILFFLPGMIEIFWKFFYNVICEVVTFLS